MLWVTRATSWASVINGLADCARLLLAGARRRRGCRAALITARHPRDHGDQRSRDPAERWRRQRADDRQARAARGVHRSWACLIVAAVSRRSRCRRHGRRSSARALHLIFAYGGYEVIPVPGRRGERPEADRAVRADHDDLSSWLIVMTLVQVVAHGRLPASPASRTPLADAALVFVGGWGALLMTSARRCR